MWTKLAGGQDTYEYKEVVFENGIRVLLSRSDRTCKAAVGLSVKVGGFSDPEKHPGLAHFLEHMLFMGTEEHPDENYYMDYVHKHNGSSNAYTTDEMTWYYYDIDSKHLIESMEIFSGFFRCPLIREDSLEREVHAVDSEHNNNILSESWRKRHLLNLMAKKDTPFRKFQTGTLETLKDAGRSALVEFWRRYYRPERMCVAVHGRETFEQLEEAARRNFSKIPAEPKDAREGREEGGVASSATAGGGIGSGFYSIFGSASSSKFAGVEEREAAQGPSLDRNKEIDEKVYVPPIKGRSDMDYYIFEERVQNKVVVYRPAVNISASNCNLTITIVLPESITNYKRSTMQYLTLLMRGTGMSSFTSVLLLSGICSDVKIWQSNTTINTLLTVSVDLTKDDLSSIGVVTGLLVKYIEIIRENADGTVYDMMKRISDLEFEYKETQEPQELVESAAGGMQYYPTEEFERHMYMWEEFSREELLEYIDIAMDREKWILQYRTSDFTRNPNFESEDIEVDSIYGINYAVEEIPEKNHSLLERLESKLLWSFSIAESASISEARRSGEQLAVGVVPTEIDAVEIGEGEKVELKIEREGCTAYLVYNGKFRVKKSNITVKLETDEFLSSSRRYTAFVGYMKAFLNIFKEKYKTEISASMGSVSMFEKDFGVLVTFEGTPVVLENLIEKFFSEYVAKETGLFELSKEAAILNFQNRIRRSPYKGIADGVRKSRGYPVFSNFECIEHAKSLQAHEIEVVRRARVKILGTGNTTKKEFERIVDIIGKYVIFSGKTFEVHGPVAEVEVPTEDAQNRAVGVMHRVAQFDAMKNAAVSVLLTQIRSEEFFDEIRTKEKYGYIVMMNCDVVFKEPVVMFVIQSTEEAKKIKKRILRFISDTPGRIRGLPEDQYRVYKESAIASVTEEVYNIKDYEEEIFENWEKHEFNLSHKKELAAEIEKITQEELAQYAESIGEQTTYIHVSNRHSLSDITYSRYG